MTEDSEVISAKERLLKVTVKEMLVNELVVIYPDCFSLRSPQPLKFLIRDDILADHPELDERILKQAMKRYCGNKEYLEASVKEGVQRIDLSGKEVGEVLDKDKSYINARLKSIAKSNVIEVEKRKARAKRRAKEREAVKAADIVIEDEPKLDPIIEKEKPDIIIKTKRPILKLKRGVKNE